MNEGRQERKIIMGGLWGSVTIVIVWAVGLVGLTIPTEVAQAMTVIFASVAGYYQK